MSAASFPYWFLALSIIAIFVCVGAHQMRGRAHHTGLGSGMNDMENLLKKPMERYHGPWD